MSPVRPAALLCMLQLVACRPDESLPPATIDEADAPTVLSERMCDALFDCSCDTQYDERGDCIDVEQLRLTDSKTVADNNGLRYDAMCVATIFNLIGELGCDTPFDDEPASHCVSCKPYFGTRKDGEDCSRLGATVPVDDCGQGLACVDRVCSPLCPDDAMPPEVDLELLPGGEPCVLNDECRSAECIDEVCTDVSGLVCAL